MAAGTSKLGREAGAEGENTEGFYPLGKTQRMAERLKQAWYGARRENRTPTLRREPDFESGASASSAIRAGGDVYCIRLAESFCKLAAMG